MQRDEVSCPRPQSQQLLELGVSKPRLLMPGPSVCSGGGDGGGRCLSRTYLRFPPPTFGAQEGKGRLLKTRPPSRCLAQICPPLEPGRQFNGFPGEDKP